MSTTEPLAVAVVLGSTRPGRRADPVARWVHEQLAREHPEARVELVDIADAGLPLLDEPNPPIQGCYERPHTQAWADTIDGYDAFVFVTPEYNHSVPGALKNAIDFLYEEWADKAAGIVSYGVDAGGARAAEHLRVIVAELRVATVRAQVALSIMDDFTPADGIQTLAPRAFQSEKLTAVGDQVVAWGTALRPLRAKALA